MKRIGLCEAAELIGRDRKTVGKWRRLEGCPFGEDGLVDPDELARWAEAKGLLNRGRGRPAEVDRLATALPVPAAAPAPPPAVAAPAAGPPTLEAILKDLSHEERQALEDLVSGDGPKLLDIASKPELMRNMALIARTRKELADAKAKELANQQKQGSVVVIDDVRRFWGAQISVVKTRFQALPGKLALRLVGLTYDQIHQALEEELTALLHEFATEVPA